MPPPLHRLLNRWIAFVHDLLMIPLAWLGAYWLRFNLETIPPNFWGSALTALLYIVPLQAAVFWYFGLYRGVWRFASLPDLMRIARAVAAGLILIVLADLLLLRLEWVPRSVPVIYGILLLLLLSAPRFFYRWLKERRFRLGSDQRILVVGAGRAGEMLVRDLLRGGGTRYLPVAFVDDDPHKQGREVHGVRVVAGCAAMAESVERLGIDLVMLAVPSASRGQMRRLVELAEGCGVPFRTVPQLDDLVSGQVEITQFRPVSIEDLLGREPVHLDWAAIGAGLTGKVILVSGGGGSIGAELCRQLAPLEPAALLLLERCEFNLYTIELELSERFPGLPLYAQLGSVCDRVAVDRLFSRYRPAVVFHAAAYKHVPLLEGQIREAVRNNVLGTRELAAAADRYGCSEFVLISTDKAVNPTNVMGATKRVAELYCQQLNNGSKTRYLTVRFGNVLGSAGSVVPRFAAQIAAGGPVTVTDPRMERFFMTVREACQLIMQAAVIGQGGEILVLDMGEPVRIAYLAEQMIRLSGKLPGEEIEIVYSGLRPGEKLHEELFYTHEELLPTAHAKIRLARNPGVGGAALTQLMAALEAATLADDQGVLAQLLHELLPHCCVNHEGTGSSEREQ